MKRLREVFFILIFGLFQYSRFHLFECKKLDGYKFPVYSTEVCPRNQIEWKERSSALNCTEDNGYLCLPNENITELLEFCYGYRFIWIQEGVCLYLKFRHSLVDSYSCSHFLTGCHNASFPSYQLFEYPDCTTIGNGCFLSESSCKGSTFMTDLQTTTERMQLENNTFMWIIFGTVFGTSVLLIVCLLMFIYYRKRNYNRRRNDEEDKHEEKTLLAFRTNQSERIILADKGSLICEGNDQKNSHDEEEISPLVPQIESGGLESIDEGKDIRIRNDEVDKHEDRELSQRYPPNQPKRLLSDEKMEGGKTWREAISSEELKTLFKRFEVQIPDDPSGKSFAGKLLRGDFLRDFVQDVRSLADGVDITRKIDRNADVKPGTMYAFEIDIGRMGDKCFKELTESGFLDQANENLTRVLLIKAKSIGVIDAKLIVYGKCKYDVDRLNIYLQHIYEDFDEIAKLSAYKKISFYRSFVREMIDTFSTYNLGMVIIESVSRVLTKANIRRVCFEVVVRYDHNYVGTVENIAYNCRFSSTVTRIKEILTEATLRDTAKKLGSEICKGISMHIESVVQSTLSKEFGNMKSDMSDFIFREIDATVIATVLRIFDTIYGVINSVTTFFITIFRPVDVNSEEWRRQVADEVYFNIWKKGYFLRDSLLDNLTNLCLKTREDLEFITSELEEFQKRVIPEDQKQLIKEWEQRDIIKDKSSWQNHPSIVQFIVGHKGDRKPVVKVLTRDDEETTKSFFISCCKVSKDTKFEFENVQDTNKLYDDNEQVTYVSDKRKSKDLKEFIQRNAKKIYAKYSNIVGMRIGCVSRVGDTKTDSHGIILYCLDKSIIPFGENPLPEHLAGWPCSYREDFFMFGKCPKDCLSTNHKLPEPGCSIGIPLCAWLGSVGFLYESINPNNEFGSGFLTASHVAIKDFQELYHDETPLSNHSLRPKKYLIVHPTCQNDQHVGNTNEHYQVVGEVVESFIGNFGTSGKSLDIAIVRSVVDRKEDKEPLPVVNEDDLSTDNNLNVMKKGSTTGTTYGDLLDCSLFTRINEHPLSPCFFSMENVYLVGNKSKNEPFSKEGDSGSGVFLMGEKPYKPLGLVIGNSKNFQQTLVCKIDEFLDKFGLKIAQ